MTARAVILIVALMTTLPAWAQFVSPGAVVPVVANNPGLNGTFWRSDVSVLNTGSEDTTIIMYLFPELVGGEPAFDFEISDQYTLPAGQQRTFTNVVQAVFGHFDKKGSLSVSSTTGAALVVSSRVFTFGDNQCSGSYGQDVSSVLVANEAWAAGLEHSASFRSNLGVFLPIDPPEGAPIVYTVEVKDNEGAVVGSGTLLFRQSGLQQVNLETFGVDLALNASIHVSCSDQFMPWYAYVSQVDQTSGDAVFRTLKGRQQDLPKIED